MAGNKTGISRDLIIHPGETIADVLEERGITQAELATRTGVSPVFVSNVIRGKKGISADFALSLEYALAVPKTFWLNLQANYTAELLEFNESESITDEERIIRKKLKNVVSHMRAGQLIPAKQSLDQSIISLRKFFQISNLENLGGFIPGGAFRLSKITKIDSSILGAWIRLCQIAGEESNISTRFYNDKVDQLISDLKTAMLNPNIDLQEDLKDIFSHHGIDFSIIMNFSGAPVQGYISKKADGTYQMALTLRGAFADIFWFTLFHELGHIYSGDINRTTKYIDYGDDGDKETSADVFARDKLIDPQMYQAFLSKEDSNSKGKHSIESIKSFAKAQNILPCIIIGRLQKEGKLDYSDYSEYKLRYKWSKDNYGNIEIY
ncbi:MAG: HigA family addiction module antidote protein [Fastidiosipila sp.]|nr:HigA family addiction module antidote protein [Fastidiosipila sp.]